MRKSLSIIQETTDGLIFSGGNFGGMEKTATLNMLPNRRDQIGQELVGNITQIFLPPSKYNSTLIMVKNDSHRK